MKTQNKPDERTLIQIQIATYREIARLATDEESREYIQFRIAELERRLRQMEN